MVISRGCCVTRVYRRAPQCDARVARLVGIEARSVGGKFEQVARRLAEIERTEIEAVDLARRGDAGGAETFGPAA